MSKTWISIQLETTLAKTDPLIQKFMKDQKAELTESVALFIEGWLRERSVPMGLVAGSVSPEFAATRGLIEELKSVDCILRQVPRRTVRSR